LHGNGILKKENRVLPYLNCIIKSVRKIVDHPKENVNY